MSIIRLPRAVVVQVYCEFAADDRTDHELVTWCAEQIALSCQLASKAPNISAGLVPVQPKKGTPT